MSRIRSSRTISILAALLAATVLLSSTGCGFCLFQFNCGTGCCVDFRCRVPEDCPLMVVPIKSKNPPPAADTAVPNTAQP